MFATVILRVTQIEPGEINTLEQVKDKVRDKVAADKARAEISAKYDEVEDNRSAGKTLKDIAAAMKLSFVEVTADQRGLTPEAKSAIEGPDATKIVGLAFSANSGTDTEIADLANGGHAWVNLLSTDAPKQRTFDQVKDTVKGAYMVDEQARLVAELAKKLAERVNAGEALSAIAGDAGGKVEKTEPITRVTLPTGLSENVVAQSFTLPKDRAGHALNPGRTSEIIFKVSDIIPAGEPTKPQLDELKANLAADLTNQTLTEYTESLKARFKATVNDAELKRVLGQPE